MYKNLALKYLPILLVVIVLVLLFKGNEKPIEDSNDVGQIIYPSALIGGDNIDTQKLLGKKYVLHFFASWCGYCVKEHYEFLEMSVKLPIYAIAWRDSAEEIGGMIKKTGNPYTNIGFDPSGHISEKLKISVVPQTFIIDENGKIIFHKLGSFDPRVLEKFFK